MVALNSDLIELAAAGTNAPPTADAIRALRSRPAPVALRASHAGRNPLPIGFNLSLPGVVRRMVIHPVTRHALIAGKVYGLMLLAAVQVLVLLLPGCFLFGVNLGDHLGGIVVVMLV